MTIFKRITLGTAVGLLCLATSHAADITGKWTADFDSQIGPQKYIYHFKTEGGKTTGKALYDHSMGKGESELSEIKVEKDDVSFTESVHTDDIDLTITYKGKLTGDEMKIHRVVGDFGSEDIIIKRAKTEAKTEAKPETGK